MWFWLFWRAKHPVGIRRSRAWWWVPHFIVTVPSTWGRFVAVEFVPPRKRRWSRDDMVVIFRGRYRVVEYKVSQVLWFDTKEEVLQWHGYITTTRSLSNCPVNRESHNEIECK